MAELVCRYCTGTSASAGAERCMVHANASDGCFVLDVGYCASDSDDCSPAVLEALRHIQAQIGAKHSLNALLLLCEVL